MNLKFLIILDHSEGFAMSVWEVIDVARIHDEQMGKKSRRQRESETEMFMKCR